MEDSGSDKKPLACEVGLKASALKGAPIILVVEDEALMREVVTIMLEENGFKVLTAGDGIEGLEVFRKNQAEIEYVLMDFSLPVMDGYQAVLEIRKLKPEVGILMVSGLDIAPEVAELYRKGEVEFLAKPFCEVELINALETLQSQKKQTNDGW